jgi:Fur family peroxide stress response transcriptional regulator
VQSTQRHTTQQQIILNIVKRSAGHLTAEQVYGDAQKALPRISLGTIYRNLEAFVNQGLIGKTLVRNVAHFEGRMDPHYHAVCLSCGSVENLEMSPAADIEEFFSRTSKFKFTGHELVLFGVCALCQKKR